MNFLLFLLIEPMEAAQAHQLLYFNGSEAEQFCKRKEHFFYCRNHRQNHQPNKNTINSQEFFDKCQIIHFDIACQTADFFTLLNNTSICRKTLYFFENWTIIWKKKTCQKWSKTNLKWGKMIICKEWRWKPHTAVHLKDITHPFIWFYQIFGF